MIERLLLHPFRVRFLRPFVILILTPIALMQSGITQVQKKFLSYKNTDAHNQYDRTRSYSKIKKSETKLGVGVLIGIAKFWFDLEKYLKEITENGTKISIIGFSKDHHVSPTHLKNIATKINARYFEISDIHDAPKVRAKNVAPILNKILND